MLIITHPIKLVGLFREASHGRIQLRIRISNMCDMNFHINNSGNKSCIVFKLVRFATKGFSSQVENHLMLFIDAYCILSECYKAICAEMWEEFAA